MVNSVWNLIWHKVLFFRWRNKQRVWRLFLQVAVNILNLSETLVDSFAHVFNRESRKILLFFNLDGLKLENLNLLLFVLRNFSNMFCQRIIELFLALHQLIYRIEMLELPLKF